MCLVGSGYVSGYLFCTYKYMRVEDKHKQKGVACDMGILCSLQATTDQRSRRWTILCALNVFISTFTGFPLAMISGFPSTLPVSPHDAASPAPSLSNSQRSALV